MKQGTFVRRFKDLDVVKADKKIWFITDGELWSHDMDDMNFDDCPEGGRVAPRCGKKVWFDPGESLLEFTEKQAKDLLKGFA